MIKSNVTPRHEKTPLESEILKIICKNNKQSSVTIRKEFSNTKFRNVNRTSIVRTITRLSNNENAKIKMVGKSIVKSGGKEKFYELTKSGIVDLIFNDMLQPEEFWSMCCKYFDKNSNNYIVGDKQNYLSDYIETHYKIPIKMVNPFFFNTTNDLIEKIKSSKHFVDMINLLTIFIDNTTQTDDQLFSKLVTKTENKKHWENLIDELDDMGFFVMILDKTNRLKITHLALLVLLWSIHYQYENGIKNVEFNNIKLEKQLQNQFDSIVKNYESFLPKIFSDIKRFRKLTNNNFDEIISLILYSTNNNIIFRIHDNMQSSFIDSLSELLEDGTRIITKHMQEMKYPLTLSEESGDDLWHLLTSEDKQNSAGIRKLSKIEIQGIEDIELLQKFIEPLSMYSRIKQMRSQTNKLDDDYFLFPHIQKQMFDDFERLISFNFFIKLNQTFGKDKIKGIMKSNKWYYDNIQSLIKFEQNNLSILKNHLIEK